MRSPAAKPQTTMPFSQKRPSRLRPKQTRPYPPTSKSLRIHLRNLRRLPPRLIFLSLICLVALSLPLIFVFSLNPHQSLKQIGKTECGTPLLSLPKPYGYAHDVMVSVLSRIQFLLKGGVRIDQSVLDSSIDDNHFHGWLIGHDPVTRVPFWKPTPFDFTKETKEMKRIAHTKSCYNKVRSNSLPLDRPIPDVRPSACKSQWHYAESALRASNLAKDSSTSLLTRTAAALGVVLASSARDDAPLRLPATSVVFVFYNEPLSPLLRAIHSVLNRTPRHLLHEIILVDDGSDDEAPWLGPNAEFERHLQLLPKTRLARLTGRNGLMRARNAGASLATGETVTFLDSHIEVGPGWIEPLSGRIAEGIRDGINRVVVPVIDNIDADTFVYSAGGIDVLGHTWGLAQTGITTHNDKNDIEPMQSPIMAGGLLSLSRKYFDELGFYDPEMKLWGGEEMEISFRIWLCGGTLECIPCSRVGHVFRSDKFWKGQVYKVPGEVIARNKRRASFWMGEYAQLMRISSAPLGKGQTIGPMKYYEDIKKRLQCKPYQWYLDNVYTELKESADKMLGPRSGTKGNIGEMFAASGYLRNNETQGCLDHLHYKHSGSVYGVYPCHYMRGSQSAVLTKTKLLLSGDHLLEGCVTRDSDALLSKKKCDEEDETAQTWKMKNVDGGGYLLEGEGKCLTVVQKNEQEDKSPLSLRMMDCGGDVAPYQVWDWENVSHNVLR